jgi:hypothetical protein
MGSGGTAPPFLTSALNVGQLSVLLPSLFTFENKSPPYPRDRRIFGLWGREKLFASARIRTPAVQPPSQSVLRLSYPRPDQPFGYYTYPLF